MRWQEGAIADRRQVGFDPLHCFEQTPGRAPIRHFGSCGEHVQVLVRVVVERRARRNGVGAGAARVAQAAKD